MKLQSESLNNFKGLLIKYKRKVDKMEKKLLELGYTFDSSEDDENNEDASKASQ